MSTQGFTTFGTVIPSIQVFQIRANTLGCSAPSLSQSISELKQAFPSGYLATPSSAMGGGDQNFRISSSRRLRRMSHSSHAGLTHRRNHPTRHALTLSSLILMQKSTPSSCGKGIFSIIPLYKIRAVGATHLPPFC